MLGTSLADATLARFDSVRTSFLVADILIGLAAVFSIPYYSALRSAFDGEDDLLVRAATLFSIVGIVVFSAGFIVETIALSALTDAYALGGVSRTSAVVVAQALVGSLRVLEDDFGLLVLTAGLAVYSYVTATKKRFPRWLGYAGMIGAILIVLGSLPFGVAIFVFFVGFVIFLAWIFAMSTYMLKPWASMTRR